MKSKISLSFILLLMFTFNALAHDMQESKPSLYKRLGGYDAIAAVVDDFLGRMLADPKLGRFFTGFSADSKKRVRQLIVDQLCAATGGPCVYIGRDMKTAHAGAGITDAEWQTAVMHLTATLEKFRVPEKERAEVLGAISSMKADIVEKK
jgi:hemoglobin